MTSCGPHVARCFRKHGTGIRSALPSSTRGKGDRESRMRKVATIIALVACAHAMIWMLDNRRETPPAVAGKLASLSYNRFVGPRSAGRQVSEAQIRGDLGTIAPLANAVRTYSSTHGLEAVPRVAAEFGLNVTLGIWIGPDAARNEQEIASALRLARENPNVARLVVGNEVVYRRERTPEELGRIIDRVRSQSPVPVTTAENWHVFVVHPELAEHVDIQIIACAHATSAMIVATLRIRDSRSPFPRVELGRADLIPVPCFRKHRATCGPQLVIYCNMRRECAKHAGAEDFQRMLSAHDGGPQTPPVKCRLMGWPGRAPARNGVSLAGRATQRSTSHVSQLRTHHDRHYRHRPR